MNFSFYYILLQFFNFNRELNILSFVGFRYFKKFVIWKYMKSLTTSLSSRLPSVHPSITIHNHQDFLRPTKLRVTCADLVMSITPQGISFLCAHTCQCEYIGTNAGLYYKCIHIIIRPIEVTIVSSIGLIICYQYTHSFVWLTYNGREISTKTVKH